MNRMGSSIPASPDEVGEAEREMREENLSEPFVGLVAYAKSKGCWWINLDQDGDIESDIPTFDW